jgi:hypothetical protein
MPLSTNQVTQYTVLVPGITCIVCLGDICNALRYSNQYLDSDFPTAFFGADIRPSPNMKNVLFSPNFMGENSQISMHL